MKILLIITLFSILQSSYAQWPQKNDLAPKISIVSTDKQNFNFGKLTKNTVLVFYRGSWCPYCINQLKSINLEVYPKLKNLNAQLLAISVDKEKTAKIMKKRNQFYFSVISDPKAKSLKAFKIVNQLNPDLVKKYLASYKIDIEADSGETHHMVAHPAVFIINKKGKILFSEVQTNYKIRTENSEILEVLQRHK